MKHIRLFLLTPLVLFSTVILAQQRELEVVTCAPKGPLKSAGTSQTILVCFNTPMVPLSQVSSEEDTGPLEIKPTVKGKYRWMGTSSLAFIPEAPLPNSTLFTARVPAGTKSVSGLQLKREYIWTFETPRPVIISHLPNDGQGSVELDHNIYLVFNQAMDPPEASKFLSIEEKSAAATLYPTYSARRAKPEELTPHNLQTTAECCIVLVPARSLKKGAVYTIRCKAGLRSIEGQLGTTSETSFRFTTFDEFSFLGVVNEDLFPPTQSLELRFSNPISVHQVRKHLVLNPSVKIDQSESGYEFVTKEAYFELPLRPEQEYQGMISKGLKDKFGQELGSDVTFRFRTGPHTPFVRMVIGQGVIEAYESHRYAVRLMNVDSIFVQMSRVNPDQVIDLMQRVEVEGLYRRGGWDEKDTRWVDDRRSNTDQVRSSKMWRLNLPKNVEVVKPIELDSVLGKNTPGIVLVEVDDLFPTKERRHLKALLQITNLGITAKFSRDNNLIWVTHLKDATPVADARVEIRDNSNRILWTGKTDEGGLATSPALSMNKSGSQEGNGEGQGRKWVVAKLGNDVAVMNSAWSEGIDPYAFDLPFDWRPANETFQASVFTDRGLYKAGEQVGVKGVVRVQKDGSWRIPGADRFRLVVRNPHQDEMLNVEQTLSPFGSFATTIPLGPATPLGLYWASVQVRRSREGKDVWEDVGEATFSVEAFRAAEFRVEAQIEKRSYTVGDSVTGYLTAHYLFGAPMKGETVNWRLSVSDAQWRPKGFDGYFFGPLGWLSRYSRGNGYRVLATSKGVLDERGMIASTSRLRVGEIPGSAMLLLEGDVTSPSRQVISGRASVIVHGGEYYLGISPSSTFISVDSSLTYNLVTVNPDGKLLPKNSISVKVLKRIWRSTRKASTEGLYTWISQQEDIVVDSAVTASDVIPVAGRFTPKEAGFYFLEARSTDARGNVLLTHAYFYVSGHGYVAWQRADDDKIELVPSKENYLPGETAHIIIKSPFETARALVTVEREGILSNFTTELKGSAAQVDIPIVSRYLPNIFVSVVLLEGRTLPPGATREGDIGRPTFKIGYTSLSVSPLEKQLSVALACDKEEYRPGDSVRVNIVVKNALGTGVSAEVALSVADLGILSLIGYRMPSLYDIFYQHHDLRVTTAETRTHIIEQRIFGEKGGEPGGGGGDDEVLTALMNVEGIRKDFRPSAYWNPSIQTDADGRATVRFKLPDNLTKFQMMASASTREAEFGYGEQSFTVSKPLMVMPALPRFARVGDAFEGGVTVFNYSSKEKLVRLISKTTGIKSQGADTTMRMLKPGQAVEMRRQLFAEFVGEAKFVFAAVTDDDTDGVQWSIPIEMRQLSETVALSGTVTGSIQREEIITPKGIYSDVGGFDFTVASTALVQLSGGMSYLFTYPYGCLEQRVSAALPVILAEDMVNAFKFEVFKDKDHKQVVQKTLDELPLFQRPNGGFAYWEKAEETYPYVSAYALYAAVVARRAGYDVDESMMSAGFQYLQRVLRGEERARYETPQITSCTKALVLYTFALAGKPDHGYMERLYEEGMKSTEATTQLPLFAKAYLLKALHVSKGNQAMIRDLSQDLLNRVKISPASAHFEESGANGMEWIFHSNVRTTALVMQALIETQPESPLIPKTVRWLLDEQRSGRWRTTQENLYVVDALSTYFRVYEQQEPNFRARLTLAGKGLLNQIFQGRSLKTASARLPLRGFSEGTRCNLDVIKSGQGRLYYTARMTYYPKGESTVKEEGIFVSKSIETLDHVPLAQHFKAGTIAKVTLTIASNQDRNYVVVDDPLPAGFETVNLSFQTTAKNLNSSGEPQHEDRMQFDYSFDHTEMHDDRVLLFEDYLPAGVHTFSYLVRVTSFGEFQMPSTRAEAMYEPEVFGQTSSCHVRID